VGASLAVRAATTDDPPTPPAPVQQFEGGGGRIMFTRSCPRTRDRRERRSRVIFGLKFGCTPAWKDDNRFVRVHVLGPMQVEIAGTAVGLGGRLARQLFAALVVRAGASVSVPALVAPVGTYEGVSAQ